MLRKLTDGIVNHEPVSVEEINTMVDEINVDELNNLKPQDHPLFLAVIKRNIPVILVLFERGVNINFELEDGNTLLDYAAKMMLTEFKTWTELAEIALVIALLGGKFKNPSTQLSYKEYEYRQAFNKLFYLKLPILQETYDRIVKLQVFLAENNLKKCAETLLTFETPLKVTTLGNVRKTHVDDKDHSREIAAVYGSELVEGLNPRELGYAGSDAPARGAFRLRAEPIPEAVIEENRRAEEEEEKEKRMEEEMEAHIDYQKKFPTPGSTFLHADLQDSHGNSALHYLCNRFEAQNKIPQSIEFMLALGARGDVVNGEQETACAYAARNGINKFALMPLLEKTNENVDKYYQEEIVAPVSLVAAITSDRKPNAAAINSVYQAVARKREPMFKTMSTKLMLPQEWQEVIDKCKKAGLTDTLIQYFSNHQDKIKFSMQDLGIESAASEKRLNLG